MRRLLARTERDVESGCLRWTGARIWSNYGAISVRKWGGQKRVHRVSYELFIGPIPGGYDIEHVCHTRSDCNMRDQCPHRLCIEPTHLEAITHHENLLRGRGVPGRNAKKTHCIDGHALVGKNLYITPSTGSRQCLTCRETKRAAWLDANRVRVKARQRAWREANRESINEKHRAWKAARRAAAKATSPATES
jgi:hypothetical protein